MNGRDSRTSTEEERRPVLETGETVERVEALSPSLHGQEDAISNSAIPLDNLPQTTTRTLRTYQVRQELDTTDHNAIPRSPTLPNHDVRDEDTNDDVHPGSILRVDTETGQNDWIIRGSAEGEETDKFGHYLSQHDKELYQIYQYFRLHEACAIRLAFSMYTCEMAELPESQVIFRRKYFPILAQSSAPMPSTYWDRCRRALMGRQLIVPYSQTLSSAVNVFQSLLRTPPRFGLQVILLARVVDTPGSEFSYWQMLRSYRKGMNKHFRSSLPFRFALRIFDFTTFWPSSDLTARIKLAAYSDPRLQVILPTDIPSNSGESIFFSWPQSIPRPSMFSTYIWQTYKNQLDFAYVNLLIQDCRNGFFKVALIFDRNSSLVELSQWLESNLEALDHNRLYEINSEILGKAQLHELIYSLERYTIEKIARFVVITLKTLYRNDLAARTDPSRTRQLYIFELEDYSKRVRNYVKLYIKFLRRGYFGESKAITPEMNQKLIDDYEYLLKKLRKIKKETARASERLAKMSEFKQTQHSMFTNTLLALFIPSAFVASYYGMNVTEITGDPIPISNFWRLAVPLTVAVVFLPLIFSPTVRLGARSAASIGQILKHSWPGLVLGIPALVIAALFGWHLGTPSIEADYTGFDSFNDFVHNCVQFLRGIATWIWSAFHPREAWEVPVTHSLLVFLSIFMVITSLWKSKRSSPEMLWWGTLAIIAVLCVSLNHLDNTGWLTFSIPFFFMAFPFAVLLVVGLWTKVVTGFKRHTATPSAATVQPTTQT